MTELKQIVRLLEAQRQELLKQLEAVDRAIAALDDASEASVGAAPAESHVPGEDAGAAGVPRQVKARRVLTDAHKRALSAGRRKSRQTHDVANGLAREMPAEGFEPAIGRRAGAQSPRLVKGPTKK